MKRLLLLISFAILFLHSFTQTDVQRDNRVSPILKQALASKSGYYIFGRAGTAGFINIAVLNQSSHSMTWFTCHGRLFDSTRLTDGEYELVTLKQLDPFVLYQNICDKYLIDIAAAKDIYRVYGDKQLFDKLNPYYRALFASETVQRAKSPLQKIIALENIRKKILTQLVFLNCVHPFGLSDSSFYRTNKEQLGSMIQSNDSTVFYNVDPVSSVVKISLYKKSPEKLYVFNRSSQIIDSIPIQAEKYNFLQKEKTDVFLLYRGWLELQWQEAMVNISRYIKPINLNNSELYKQANIQQVIEKELYDQLNAIGSKINVLTLPEVKSIEQHVYETYKNETSEITYMPLIGIAYELIQKRGQKEYELTNHLGNVLAVVSDKKIGVSSASDSLLIDHYEPDIVSAQDYYPFGMLQPGRSYLSSTSGDRYRYGFNGKENDNEVKGEGNQQDYGMRVYDPRLGKFLSVDPLVFNYPWNTPYQFSGNKPIWCIDLDGAEEAIATRKAAALKVVLDFENDKSIKADAKMAIAHINKKEMVAYLKERLKDPAMRSHFNSCGPTSVGFVAITHDPEIFVNVMINLWKDGTANDGDLKVPENLSGDSKHYKNNDEIDQLLEGTLRSSENTFSEYMTERPKPSGNGWWSKFKEKVGIASSNGTLVGEYSDLLERMGASVDVSSDEDVKYDNINDYKEWTDKGKYLVMFGYFDAMLQKTNNPEENTFGGDHFVTVQGVKMEKNGNVTISFWHHGEYPNNGHEKRTYTKEQFEKSFKSVLKISNTGNNATKK